MRDNPQPASDHAFALPDHRVLSLSGRDATAFAQAQCMNDVAGLAVGHWQWNGWLTPKGRVIALFALLKFDVETLWLLLPDADPAELAAQLQRYVFRSKVALAVRDDLHVTASFAAPTRATGAQWAGDATGGIELDFGGDGGPRRLQIGRDVPTHHDPHALARWAAFDLAHGLPRLPTSQGAQWTPQMLSLERLRAFSVKKGCYPGQEIVARTHFLGQVKRGLALFAPDALVPVGSEVREGERALGPVVCAANDGDRQLALAVLPLEHAASALHVDGIELRAVPLQGGLAR